MFCSRNGRWSRRGGYELLNLLVVTARVNTQTTVLVRKRILGQGLIIPYSIILGVEYAGSYNNRSAEGVIEGIDDVSTSISCGITGGTGPGLQFNINGMAVANGNTSSQPNGVAAHGGTFYVYDRMPALPFNKSVTLYSQVYNSQTGSNYAYSYFRCLVYKLADTEIVIEDV